MTLSTEIDPTEAFLEQLDPKIRKQFKMAQESFTEKLPSASLEFNWATGGGFPRGDITTVYGNYSSTKTALVLSTIGVLQKMGYVCAFVSAENKFDKNWAARLGVDNSKLILIEKKSFGAITDSIIPLIRKGIDFLAWDSISSTLPEVFVEDGEAKEYDKQKQIGAASRSAGIAINAIHYENHRTAVVLISQTRTDMSGMYPVQKPTNGKVVEFGSSLMVKFSSSASEKEQYKEKLYVGDTLHELPVGREVKFDVVKNKVGPPNRTGKYDFYYAGDSIGIDDIAETITMGKRFGVLTGTNWIKWRDQQWNGKDKMVAALRDDPETVEAIKDDLNKIINGEVIDERLGQTQEAE